MDLQEVNFHLRSRGSNRFCRTCQVYVWVNINNICGGCGNDVPRSNQSSSASGNSSDRGPSRMHKASESQNKEFSVSELVDNDWQPQKKSKKKKKTKSSTNTGDYWSPTGPMTQSQALAAASIIGHQPSQRYQDNLFSSYPRDFQAQSHQYQLNQPKDSRTFYPNALSEYLSEQKSELELSAASYLRRPSPERFIPPQDSRTFHPNAFPEQNSEIYQQFDDDNELCWGPNRFTSDRRRPHGDERRRNQFF